MPRPQTTVTVSPALARRGTATDTGLCFLLYAGATGTLTPVECYSAADATTSNAPAAIAAWVGDVLEQGAPKVILLRAAAVNAAAVTQAEWTTALALLTPAYGPGQVIAPGVSSAAVRAALLAHAAANGNRTVFLDIDRVDTAATGAAAATGLAAAGGATRAGMFAGWAIVPATGGTTRELPASLVAAGLVARGDAYNGHANHAPASDQGRGAGVVTRGIGVVTGYSDADTDTLYNAGVNTIRMVNGAPTMTGWVSVSSDSRYRQLNWGRLDMQVAAAAVALMYQFQHQNIDAKNQLYAKVEAALRGFLLTLWTRGALYGATAAAAFDVDVAGVNTPTNVAAGSLNAAMLLSKAAHVEQSNVNVTTTIAGGAA
ncbi:MAG: hypothetical protein F2667_00280 [Actinobacteria bacterium]|nr:hypothetical protein [Actinomycetota bacterium]